MSSITKDLTPKDEKESPLRELDWLDESYAMEVVSGRMYDRDLNEIFDNLSLLNDRGGETVYMPSMAEAGDHTIKIALPPDMINLIEAISEHQHNYDLMDGLRISLLHGMCMYEHQLGCEIEKTMSDYLEIHRKKNTAITKKLNLSVNISYDHKNIACRVDGRIFRLLKKWSVHAGIQNNYLAGLWIIKSFRTHQDIPNWYSDMDTIIDTMESPIRMKLEVAKLPPVIRG